MRLRTRKLRSVRVLAFGLATLGGPALLMGQQAAFIPLGHLPGGEGFSAAYGVSSSGRVIVGASQSADGLQAVRWTLPTLAMSPLGDLPDGPFFSFATAVSEDGSVVVGSGTIATGPQAFVWTPGTGIIGLGSLIGGDGTSNATGVSADGSIVVGNSSSSNGPQAFTWTAASGMLGLGDLPGGEFASSADAVSADGSVVVGYGTTPEGFRAFRWTAATGLLPLGIPGVDGEGSAYGLSSTGDRIVGYTLAPEGYVAFSWSADSGVQGISLPGQGPQLLDANGIAADGQFIVGTADDSGIAAAAIYDAVYGTVDLQQTLVADYHLTDALQGWQLTAAYGVSADGSVIVGEGVNPFGQVEAWMVIFPRACRVPLVTSDPNPIYTQAGNDASLSVSVTSGTPLSYQWRRNGVPLDDGDGLSGTHTARLAFTATQVSQSGQYDLLIDNGCGSKLVGPVEVSIHSCHADFNHDGNVDPDDLGDYITCFFTSAGCPDADFNGDGNIDPDDLGDYITNYFSECR